MDRNRLHVKTGQNRCDPQGQRNQGIKDNSLAKTGEASCLLAAIRLILCSYRFNNSKISIFDVPPLSVKFGFFETGSELSLFERFGTLDCSARERSTSADWILIERVRQSSRSSVKSSNRNEPAFCNKTRSPADGPAAKFGFELFVLGGRFRGVSTGFCPFTTNIIIISNKNIY